MSMQPAQSAKTGPHTHTETTAKIVRDKHYFLIPSGVGDSLEVFVLYLHAALESSCSCV